MGRYLLTPFLDELSAYIDKMGFDRLIRLSYMYQPFVNVFLSFWNCFEIYINEKYIWSYVDHKNQKENEISLIDGWEKALVLPNSET